MTDTSTGGTAFGSLHAGPDLRLSCPDIVRANAITDTSTGRFEADPKALPGTLPPEADRFTDSRELVTDSRELVTDSRELVTEPCELEAEDCVRGVVLFESEQNLHEQCVPCASGRGRITVMRSLPLRRNESVT